MSYITTKVIESINNNKGLRLALMERVGHYQKVYGKNPTDKGLCIVIKSCVITHQRFIMEDLIMEAKEQGLYAPDIYARNILTHIVMVDWDKCRGSVDALMSESANTGIANS